MTNPLWEYYLDVVHEALDEYYREHPEQMSEEADIDSETVEQTNPTRC
jgi:hypothetical protein